MSKTFDLSGLRPLVVGLAREGVALSRYLAHHGARVTATDARPLEELGEEVRALEEDGVRLETGGHSPSLLDDVEILFVSPGVPLGVSLLQEARSRGIALSTESRLFCELCPAPVTAITGSSGKTTTTTLVGEMAKAADGARAWVGGNIGRPLIGDLDEIRPGDRVVMELSSFQLEYFHPSVNDHVRDLPDSLVSLLSGWSPRIGAILNVTPNHLDRHPSMDAYIHAKRALVDYREPGGIAVMGRDNDVTRSIGESLGGEVWWFGREAAGDGGCAFIEADAEGGGRVVLRRGTGEETPVCRLSEIKLRGMHNVYNVLAACAVGGAMGIEEETMGRVITFFTGVRHRLDLVREAKGVRYYNDSIATSPERLVAALESFEEPIVLLAGGRDKHLPWEQAAALIREKVRHLVLFGEASELIARAVLSIGADVGNAGGEGGLQVHRCVRLEDAVSVASLVARTGDVVLLSPGCTSYDSFRDFAERGDRFAELVMSLD